MTLSWTPVPGASGYVLSWSPPAGETSGWRRECRQRPHRGLLIPLTVPCVAAGGEKGRTLPSTASSLQVSGLRLGQRYTFTLRPLLGSAPGAETSISERTGTAGPLQGHCRAGQGLSPLRWWFHPFPACSLQGCPRGRGLSGARHP